MSWGNKLVVVFIGFAVLMGTLVYKAMNTKFDLVTKDYYKEELRYQEKLDAIKNANLVSDIAVAAKNDVIEISFPHELKGMDISGEAWFYCETNADKDKLIPVNMKGDTVFNIHAGNIGKGSYTVKVKWQAGNTSYFAEKLITVI